jgi:hypothetical protein
MGYTTWDPGAYSSYARSVAGKSGAAIFTNTSGCHDDLNPVLFRVRESCDSAANPQSTPIIIGVDETGSMGHLATEIIKGGLGTIVQGIRDRKPVPDPHILLAAIGDATCDRAPIQATQFEAGTELVAQIEKFFIEGCGGGNGGESYPIVWWLARHKTSCDAITKRGRRGYLFTIGDEAPLHVLTRHQIRHFLGAEVESDVTIEDLLAEVQSRWHVFHLITPTDATTHQDAVRKWRALLGERAMVVSDHRRLGEVIVSAMQVNEGQDVDTVTQSWDGSAALVVRNAVAALARRPRVTAVTEEAV